MVEDDLSAREGAGEIGELVDLRVIEPCVERKPQTGEDSEAFAKGLVGKQKKDIFRPGYSTKSRGWGLGLPLAKRIIEEYHHGKLFVKESAPGKGTTFRIKLG